MVVEAELMRLRSACVWAALGLVIILTGGLVSCNGSGSPGPEVTVPLTAVRGVTSWPEAQFYWRDIAGHLYSDEYRNSYTYQDARVALTYHRSGDWRFCGSIVADNLKPDFAYQIKLVGKPTADWGAQGNDWANESLGQAGRWWRKQPNPGNSDDVEYAAYQSDPAYRFEGYLLTDFFVTDSTGHAAYEFEANNAYHVLWKTLQRPPGPNDGPVRKFTVGDEAVEIYGEWEPWRARPTAATLRPGTYDVRLVLTEESWHSDEAQWASAVGCDAVRFEVLPSPLAWRSGEE
jgi:hypothetical protein